MSRQRMAALTPASPSQAVGNSVPPTQLPALGGGSSATDSSLTITARNSGSHRHVARHRYSVVAVGAATTLPLTTAIMRLFSGIQPMPLTAPEQGTASLFPAPAALITKLPSQTPAPATTYTITCTGVGGTATDSITIAKRVLPYTGLVIRVGTDPWQTQVDSVHIYDGEEIKLRWISTDANSCTGSGDGFSVSGVSGIDATVTEPSAGDSTTYTVTCTGDGGTATDSLTVSTRLPPTANLERQVDSGSWSPNDAVITDTDQVSLGWSSTDAASCSGAGDGFDTGGAVLGTDYFIIEPLAGTSTTYTVTCVGGSYTIFDSLTITTAKRPTATLERQINSGYWGVADATIIGNDQVSLRWSSTDATACGGTNFTAATTSGIDATITEPTAGNSITYTVTCNGPGGIAFDSIIINKTSAPSATLERQVGNNAWSENNALINVGDEVKIRWSSTDATSCTGSGFQTSGITDGTDATITEPALGNSNTYIVTCTGDGSQVADSLTVTTGTGSLTYPTVTLERQTAGGLWQTDNVIIDAGEDVNLRWISANATICTGDGFDTASTTSGSKAIVEPGAGTSTAYIVSCTSSEGTVSDSLTITARGLPFVTANPPVIRPVNQGGGISTISWDTKGSLACVLSGSGLPSNLGSHTVGSKIITNIEITITATVSCPSGSRSSIIHATPGYFEE